MGEEDEDHSDESYDEDDEEEDDDEEDDDDNDEDEDEDEDEGDDEDDDDDEEDDDDNDDMEDDDKCECDDVNKSDDRENRHKRINNRENTIKIRKVFQNGRLVEINREEIKPCKRCRNQSLKMHDVMNLRYNCSKMSKIQQQAHLWCRGL